MPPQSAKKQTITISHQPKRLEKRAFRKIPVPTCLLFIMTSPTLSENTNALDHATTKRKEANDHNISPAKKARKKSIQEDSCSDVPIVHNDITNPI
mmetsp:Transcript_13185/g.20101  ORF Transcript_13185/g.20101 Transcript_13185/m.20101 type:complete len:96 (+) Transcript_13185:36-323(+)